MPISRLMNFFLSDILFLKKKKNVPLGAQKRTKQDTFPFFLLICFCSFFFICMYYISLFVFALSCCDTRGFFSFFSLLLQFCVSNIRYSIPEILGPTYVEKRKISYFVLARYLIQHRISPNQDDISYSARTFISG